MFFLQIINVQKHTHTLTHPHTHTRVHTYTPTHAHTHTQHPPGLLVTRVQDYTSKQPIISDEALTEKLSPNSNVSNNTTIMNIIDPKV